MQKPRNFVTAPYTNLIFLPAFTLIIVIITWRWSRRLFSKWGCNGKSASSISNVFWYSIFIRANRDMEKAVATTTGSSSLLANLVCRRHDSNNDAMEIHLASIDACLAMTDIEIGFSICLQLSYARRTIKNYPIHFYSKIQDTPFQTCVCCGDPIQWLQGPLNGLRIFPKIGWPWFMVYFSLQRKNSIFPLEDFWVFLGLFWMDNSLRLQDILSVNI